MQTSAVPAQPKIAAVPLTTMNASAPRRRKVPRPAIKALGPLARHFWRRRQPQQLFDEKGLIPPVTFDRVSGKFPPMKAWIYIYAIVFAAGMLTALADETKTNTHTGETMSIPANTNEVAVPPPMTATSAPAPVVAHKVKPPVVVPLMQTSAVPAQPNITAAPLTTTNAITPPPMTATSAPAPAVASEARPSNEVSLMQTGAVPAQSNIIAGPPSESSGIGRSGVLAISVAFLAVAGGLTVFLLRRQRTADHASLITRAMNEDKDTGKHEDKQEDKREDKREDKKFPPPMT